MTPAEMGKAAVLAINARTLLDLPAKGATVVFVTPKCFKPPKGFPRGELYQVKEDGSRVKAYSAIRVLAWLTANGFVRVQPPVGEENSGPILRRVDDE